MFSRSKVQPNKSLRVAIFPDNAFYIAEIYYIWTDL